MSNEKKENPVEWLSSQLGVLLDKLSLGQISMIELQFKRFELENQAKEMQKKVIMQSYSDGLGNGIEVGRDECSLESVADEEKYYEKTFLGSLN